MKSRRRFFAPAPRCFPGQRWVNIGLRCLHLVGVAGTGGGFLYALPAVQWQAFWTLTLATGVLLALLYLWTDLRWIMQLKGQAIVVKLALLALAQFEPAWRAEAFVLVVIVSGLFAHAPAQVRGYGWGLWDQERASTSEKRGG